MTQTLEVPWPEFWTKWNPLRFLCALFTLEFELIFPAQLDWLSDFAQLLGVLIVFPALYYVAEIFWRVSRVDEPIHIHQTQQKRTAFPPQRSLLLHTHLFCRRPESSSSLSSSVNFVARRRLGPRFSSSSSLARALPPMIESASTRRQQANRQRQSQRQPHETNRARVRR